MKTRVQLLRSSLLSLAVVIAACGGGVDVRTMSAPEARFDDLHAFRILQSPTRRDGLAPVGDDDPMISNTIANRALRDRIARAFQEKGYPRNEQDADFGVAFYATARDKLDVARWDYGYPPYPRWPRYPSMMTVAYTEGSVVVDVVRLHPRELLWRGEGKAQLSDDPADNVKQLSDVAAAIVDKFPQAARRIVAARR